MQRKVVLVIGLLAGAVAAKVGYDIGVRITSPWLGLVMALNLALLVGLLTPPLCDRLWTWLRRVRRNQT